MLRHRRALLFALLIGTIIGAPLAISARQVPLISVQVNVGFSCVDGFGPPREDVTATLLTRSGAVRDQFTAHTGRRGFFTGCFRLFNPTTNINGGDRLRVRVGNRTRRIVVPHVEPQINRVTDVIEGWAQPNADVDVFVTHSTNFRDASDFAFSTVADATGHYRIDTTGDVNLVGWDIVDVESVRGEDVFIGTGTVPGMQVASASNDIYGFMNNGTDLLIQVKSRNGQLKGDATAGPFLSGTFEIEMFNDDGFPLYPLAHDRVVASFASDAAMTIPVSRLRASAESDTIWGHCPANAPYQLDVRARAFFGITDSAGNLKRIVGARLNLRRGDQITLYCRFRNGDIWQDIQTVL